MASGEQNERDTYRVTVLGRGGTQILLVPNGERLTLPSVEIPRWLRVAENLTIRFKSDWREDIVVLFELPALNDGPRYVAAERLSPRFYCNAPTRWVPVSALPPDSLIEPRDHAAIEEVTKLCKGEIKGTCAGPFARLGWFCDLRNWIDSVIEPMGFHVAGTFRQLNASASFSLIRFETNGPALWFKAVGEPNQREFGITSVLAQLFPEYLPPLLATRRDWNGWLSKEVEGELLSGVPEQGRWEQAAAALARLQIAHLWKDEFGVAEDPEDFAVLSAYSPYHKVRDNTAYPATMIVSGDQDQNCNPLHARKMTARLQAANISGHPIFLDYSQYRGHSPVLPLSERVEALTDRTAFLSDQLQLACPE